VIWIKPDHRPFGTMQAVDLDKQHLAAEHNHFQYTHSPEAEEFLRIDD
jgi:hypothetical protein